MNVLNEYSQIKEVAIRSPLNSFIDDNKLSSEWEALRFHSKPDFKQAINEASTSAKCLHKSVIKFLSYRLTSNSKIRKFFMSNLDSLDKIVSLAKARGFIFQYKRAAPQPQNQRIRP